MCSRLHAIGLRERLKLLVGLRVQMLVSASVVGVVGVVDVVDVVDVVGVS